MAFKMVTDSEKAAGRVAPLARFADLVQLIQVGLLLGAHLVA